MKKFVTPEMKVIYFEEEDVISTSGDIVDGCGNEGDLD